MPRYPWFRVYNEILTERKIERIGRMTDLPRVVIRGAWMTILAMANDSPQRGYLMWTDDLWITEQEIADDLEMEPGNFGMLLDALIKMQMVTRHNGGGLSCTNFDKRQFASDYSTPRVQRYRERQAEQAQETTPCNVSGTLLCNAPDTEAEAETDTDTEADTQQEQDAPAPQPVDSSRPVVVDVVLLQELLDLGVTDNKAQEIVQRCDPDCVRGWLRHVHDDDGSIRSPPALLVDALLNKQTPPPKARASPDDHTSKDARRRYALEGVTMPIEEEAT